MITVPPSAASLVNLAPLPAAAQWPSLTGFAFDELLGSLDGSDDHEDLPSGLEQASTREIATDHLMPTILIETPFPIAFVAQPKPSPSVRAVPSGAAPAPSFAKKTSDQAAVYSASLVATASGAGPPPTENLFEISPAAPPQNDRHLDLAKDDLWLGQLAREIVEARQHDQVSFRLSPPHLGKLDVTINAQQEGITVQLCAGKAEVRDILTDVKSSLVEQIQVQGVRVIEATISPGGQNLAEHNRHPPKPMPLIEAERPKSKVRPNRSQRRKPGRFA
jgi:hypothetical protein